MTDCQAVDDDVYDVTDVLCVYRTT